MGPPAGPRRTVGRTPSGNVARVPNRHLRRIRQDADLAFPVMSATRRVLLPIALAVGASACTPTNLSIGPDTTIPQTTLIRITPETAAPPTTPMVTAYPTIPPVTAVVPYWSPVGWTIPQIRVFLAMVESALTDLGTEHTMDSTNGIATLDNGTSLDLTLLAAELTLVPGSMWQKTVSTYLGTMLSPDRADTAFTFEIAQSLLRVRVGTLGSLGLSVDQGVVQPIADDLVVAVCVEQSTSTTFLTPAQVAVWGKSPEEIVALAISQTLGRPIRTEQAGPFTVVTGDQFASSRILDPSMVMKSSPPDGFLVSIPSIDQFLAVRVDADLTIATINLLVSRIAEDFNDLNNPASPDLYWWRNGGVTVLHPQGSEIAIPTDLQALIAA